MAVAAGRMTKAQAFSLLGVDEDASESDIRSAYRYVFFNLIADNREQPNIGLCDI